MVDLEATRCEDIASSASNVLQVCSVRGWQPARTPTGSRNNQPDCSDPEGRPIAPHLRLGTSTKGTGIVGGQLTVAGPVDRRPSMMVQQDAFR
jgi:hypothetical protein